MRSAKSIPFILSAAAGVLCLAAAVICCLRLEQGSLGDKIFIAAGLGLFAALGLLLLRLEGVGSSALPVMILLLGGAMLIRVLCLDHATDDYKDFLLPWYTYFKTNGGFAAIADDVGNYNVPYLYFMAAISYLNIPDLYLIKLFSILFDVLLAWGGFRLVSVLQKEKCGNTIPLVAFAVLLFLPTVVLNGAYWGQCDVIYGALTLHAVAQLLAGKNKSSAALLAAAFSFKLQTVFLIPLWGILWFARRVKFRELLIFPLTCVITAVPALLLGKPLKDIAMIYLGQMTDDPRLTLNAPSIYQLVPFKMEVDYDLFSALGIAAAAALVLLLLALGLWLGRRLDNRAAIAMAAVLAIGVPFLLPHMHERYFFLADVITLCWACAHIRRIPAPILVCGSSLASYIVYLRMKYNFAFRLGGMQFVMIPEMLAMLAALVIALVVMAREVRRCLRLADTGR